MVGFALFGALTYLPLFQQVVHGLSPTASGLQLLPMMGGMLVTSIVSGQVITRTGRYKAFPIAGTAVAALGLWLLSLARRDDRHRASPRCTCSCSGSGSGMVMQVLVLAVQNAVPYGDARRGDLGRDAVPLDRRLARHGDPRRDLHEVTGW